MVMFIPSLLVRSSRHPGYAAARKISGEQTAAKGLICHDDQSHCEYVHRQVGRCRVKRMKEVEQCRGRRGRGEPGN